MKKTTRKKPTKQDPTITQYAQATIALLNDRVLDFGGIVEALDLDWDGLVRAEMEKLSVEQEEDQSDATCTELCVTQDLAYQIGVAVGRRLGGAR